MITHQHTHIATRPYQNAHITVQAIGMHESGFDRDN